MISICSIDDGIRARRGSFEKVDVIKCSMDWSDAQGSHPVSISFGAYKPGNFVARGSQGRGDRTTDIA